MPDTLGDHFEAIGCPSADSLVFKIYRPVEFDVLLTNFVCYLLRSNKKLCIHYTFKMMMMSDLAQHTSSDPPFPNDQVLWQQPYWPVMRYLAAALLWSKWMHTVRNWWSWQICVNRKYDKIQWCQKPLEIINITVFEIYI